MTTTVQQHINEKIEKFIQQNRITGLLEQEIRIFRDLLLKEEKATLKDWEAIHFRTITYFDSMLKLIWNEYKNLIINEKFKHPLFEKIIQADEISDNEHLYLRNLFIFYVFDSDEDKSKMYHYLRSSGFEEMRILQSLVTFYSRKFLFKEQYGENAFKELTPTAVFFNELIKKQTKVLGFFGKDAGYKDLIEKIILNNGSFDTVYEWVVFLQQYHPEKLSDFEGYIFYNEEQNVFEAPKKPVIRRAILFYLIEHYATKREAHFLELINGESVKKDDKLRFYFALDEQIPNKYDAVISQLGKEFLEEEFIKKDSKWQYYYDESYKNWEYLGEKTFDLLLKNGDIQYINNFYTNPNYGLSENLIAYADEKFGEKSLSLLIPKLFQETFNEYHFHKVFKIIEKYDFTEHIPQLLDYMINMANTSHKKRLAKILALNSEKIEPIAIDLLKGKTINERIVGALLLSEINSEKGNLELDKAVDNETNDDTRDIMLEALTEKRFAKPFTISQIENMIRTASQRKKLAKWNEKAIAEEAIPKLYWKENQEPLSEEAIRFLFYRMKRTKGLNSDIEARQLLHQIDRNRSSDFSKFLINSFKENNADAKLKYYLTLSAFLGDDEITRTLTTLFNQSVTGGRAKMAEYIIGALAMVGSNRALRQVELISRKLASKKPALSEVAIAALEAAAIELNITKEELEDRIIPTFDFDGLYKNIEIEGEEYRAFIGKDFKINFLDENNKVKKSLPSKATKEQKAEFKEIEKELREVVKSQSGRLEKYMVEERRWDVKNWQEYIFMNPVMNAFALQLLWGIFDEQDNLTNVFYCSEDASLYDENDEEIELNETQRIGILHPIYLSENQLEIWKNKCYDMGLITCFPILDRKVFFVSDNEKDLSESDYFKNQSVPKGADFVVSFLEKRLWAKSTGDGGSVEFRKTWRKEFTAFPQIEGPAAYYQGGDTPAKVYGIRFTKGDNEKTTLGAVSKIFYSEVMKDIFDLINAN